MDILEHSTDGETETPPADKVQEELDRYTFHLKTLYDISKTIYGSVRTETILKNFLLMIMGNFGVLEAFVTIVDRERCEATYFHSVGCEDGEVERLKRWSRDLSLSPEVENGSRQPSAGPPPPFSVSIPLEIADGLCGQLVLGPKIIGEDYTANDRELIETLTNSLIISLKNARSFEAIQQLNEDLKRKNEELEEALGKLKDSIRKVELLESIKDSLSKFLPNAVTSVIEKSTTGSIPNRRKQDLSVLFVDIEGYTQLCERLGSTEISEILEKHFSAFMGAIHANNGDISDTAGDGLMVLFLNEDEKTNAREAIQAALDIREKSISICSECGALEQPLKINMGINSGQALFGASKFQSYTGERWVYTAIGNVVNIAARVGGKATGGDIFLTQETAGRVASSFDLKPVGELELKNVSKPVSVFKL